MSREEEIVALQELLRSYDAADAVLPEHAARAAALVRRSKLKKGVTAGALHRLLEALAEASEEARA